MVSRALAFLVLLPGCGLVAGLRTDYELVDGSTEAGDAQGDGAIDSGVDGQGEAGCTMPTDTTLSCGGPNCPKCQINGKCQMNGDCQSGNCSNNRCRP